MFNAVLFLTGSHYAVLAGLKLTELFLPPSLSQVLILERDANTTLTDTLMAE